MKQATEVDQAMATEVGTPTGGGTAHCAEPDYECDCPDFGDSCENAWDDHCEFPWLRKEQ